MQQGQSNFALETDYVCPLIFYADATIFPFPCNFIQTIRNLDFDDKLKYSSQQIAKSVNKFWIDNVTKRKSKIKFSKNNKKAIFSF